MKKHLLWLLLVLCLTMALLAVPASAADTYTSGDWVFSVSDGDATLAGYTGTATSITLPTSVTLDGINYKIRAVGSGAFSGNARIQKVVIPAQYNSIGTSAFKNCTNLSSLTINGDLIDHHVRNTYADYTVSNSPFYHAGANTDGMTVTFGEGVTRVPAYLFATGKNQSENAYACVTKVILPDTCTTIGAGAFQRCFDLASVDFGGVTEIESYAFAYNTGFKTLTVASPVQTIGSYAFAYDTGLTTLKLANTVQTAGDYAFTGDTGLTSVTLSSKLANIGAGGFMDCTKLPAITLPASVKSIGVIAFKNCTNLSSVTINGDLSDHHVRNTYADYTASNSPFYHAGANTDGMTVTFGEGVTRVPAYLFATGKEQSDNAYACVSKLILPDTCTTIGAGAFRHCYDLASVDFGGVTEIESYAFADNSGFKTLSITSPVQTIGSYAFAYDTGLTTLKMDSSVQSIGDYAFTGDTGLTSVTLSSKLANIGAGAFMDCAKLPSVTLPASVKSIGVISFKNCTNLSSVTINGDLSDHHVRNTYADYTVSNSPFYHAGTNANGMTVTFGSGVTRVPAYLFATGKEQGSNVYACVTKVVLPASVTEIGAGAFHNCYDLSSVIFYGTKAQFAAITVNSSNDYFTGAAVTYATDKPAITTQPKSANVKTTAYATFTVKASGSGLSYQWQYLKPNGSWTNCTSATTGYNTATLKVQGVTGSTNRNGYKYRCVVKNSGGSVTSGAVTLNVLAVTTQPKAATVSGSSYASFTVSATGAGLSYQWQYLKPNGSWTNCTSATTGYNTATLKVQGVTGSTNRNGYQYRCKVTDSAGNTVTSSAAKLTVNALSITTQPKSASVKTTAYATFSVKASGSSLKYQWQYKTPDGTWKNCTSATQGYNTATLKVQGVTGGTNRNGYQYRCKVSDGAGTITSKAATLNVLAITTQPTNAVVAASKYASFTVNATGAGLTYQWQYKTPDGTWKNCTSATQGYNTATLKVQGVTGSTNRSGYQYRCIITDSAGNTITSKAVTLSVK